MTTVSSLRKPNTTASDYNSLSFTILQQLAQVNTLELVIVVAVIMTMKYTFDFYLDEMEKAILNLPGIPPKPTGVGLTIVELPKKQIFGFNKTGFKPFNQAPLRRN